MVQNKRIAVHVFYDLILPIQRGEPGSPEREESNKELEAVFRNSEYYKSEEDLNDLFYEDGYFTTDHWRIENDKVIFKGSDGKEYSAPKRWLIFESEYPLPFKKWDEIARDKLEKKRENDI